MASTQNSPVTDLSPTRRKEDLIFSEIERHNQIGFLETSRRAIGKNRVGTITFDEADELFRSWIDENNWPYDALLFDPRIFTFIFEKTSRLISGKPKGHLIPRKGSDVLAAKVNGALLDYQWDEADNGGTMISKWAQMDMNARKYGAGFALAKWRYETDSTGRVIFDGPDMLVLNNRDCAHSLDATNIESCNWFQVRQYVTFQDLENVNDYSKSRPIYKNLERLREAIGAASNEGAGGDSRSVNWISRNRQIARLEPDPVGKDYVYKAVEIVTEYRKDRWISFAPKHGVVIRDIPNPYQNNELPITMLRYYAIDDDLYGLSEIEPIKGLQKAINALLCQYVDEINQNLYSPIAIGPGVRQHTLEWGKGARWIMNNPMTDFRLVESRSNAAQYFNNTYSVLVSAMMNALGESSLGVSNIQPYQQDKTATEVKALQVQRNARDNFNQIFLEEAIKRQMMLWHSMNQRLIFADPTKSSYIIRIVGKDAIQWFSAQGLGDYEIPDEAVQALKMQSDLFGMNYDDFKAAGISLDNFKVPKYPVDLGTKEKRDVKPKLQTDAGGGGATLAIEPDDIKGNFDFSVDVESMSADADEERRQGRQTAVSLLVSNPNVMMMLQQEGVTPKFKELFVDWLEDLGFTDADKYFESVQKPSPTAAPAANPAIQQMMSQMAQGQPPTPPTSGGAPSPGAGANQIAKINPNPGQAAGNPTAPNLGQPNPQDLKQLISHLSGQAAGSTGNPNETK